MSLGISTSKGMGVRCGFGEEVISCSKSSSSSSSNWTLSMNSTVSSARSTSIIFKVLKETKVEKARKKANESMRNTRKRTALTKNTSVCVFRHPKRHKALLMSTFESFTLEDVREAIRPTPEIHENHQADY